MQANVNQSAQVNDIFKQTNAQLPTAGVIRPGIMVLTKAAKENIPKAESIYTEGMKVGASFEVIEKNLQNANPKFTRKPLTPRNCESFRCSQDDFNAPGAAQTIINKYGEDRGNGDGVQLYSFPVVFPVNDISLIFQQKFESWTSRELQFWSEYDDNGSLNCMKRQDVKQVNARRRFGGRPKEIVRKCDPNSCDVFADEKCNHNCSLYFYVPGCVGVGMIKLSFTSIYAALQIQQQLEMVLNGLGKIKGVHNLKPIFQITKTLDNVSRVDHKKQEVTRANQYIIKLEAVGLDMTEVFIREEQRALGLLSSTPEAVAALAPPDESYPDTDIMNDPYIDSAVDHEPTKTDPKLEISELRKNVFQRAEALQLTTEQFGNWAVKRYGELAFKIPDSLELISEALSNAESTGDISQFVEQATETTTETTTETATKKKAPF